MAASLSFQEARFRAKIDKALDTVKTILDTTRSPQYAEDEDHTYDDKYALAEFLTGIAAAAQVNVLERLGMDDSKLRCLHKFAVDGKRSVTLRLTAAETCNFGKEEVVEVENPHQIVSEVEETKKSKGKTKEKKTTVRHKVVTKVHKYYWKVGVEYELFAFAGSNPDDLESRIVFQDRCSSCTIVTTGDKNSPLPSRTEHDPIDTNLTWLLQHLLPESMACSFAIDRSVETCRTPRRNNDIKEAMDFFSSMWRWSSKVHRYFVNTIGTDLLGAYDVTSGETEAKATMSIRSIKAEGIFVPVLPLFEKPVLGGTGEGAMIEDGNSRAVAPTESGTSKVVAVSPREETPGSASPLLGSDDINIFLQEQCRALDEKIASLAKSFPPKDAPNELITSAEANVVMLALHAMNVSDQHQGCVDYIEDMLRSQLVSAIGKEVKPSDFNDFMRFHNQKLFREEYAPKPFCFAIRRPDHYPDGILSIEGSNANASHEIEWNDKDMFSPVMTVMRRIEGESAPPMFFPINAATSVEFAGPRFLHGWISQQFGGERNGESFNLTARARQFSSFLLMVGKITGPNNFDPKNAIILQNKDEVLIPLLLNQLPTPQEFKDAVASLSPEQKRFATAFRNMQLESSVFGVCVVQLKPQLEVLLGLPTDSLTKEIRLTQDLLSLFIEYQIPSDLVSFDGAVDAKAAEKVEAVKGHVKAVQDMISSAKEKQLADAVQEADMRMEEEGAQFQSAKMSMMPSSANSARYQHDRYGSATYRSLKKKSKEQRDSPSTLGMQCVMDVARVYEQEDQRMVVQQQLEQLQERAAQISEEVSCVSNLVDDGGPSSLDEGASKATPDLVPDKESPEGQAGRQADATEAIVPKSSILDFTSIPKQLDAKFEELDSDSALRATVIETGKTWTKKSQKNLLTQLEQRVVQPDEQKTEKNKAFDLLDALSRSGSLPIACAELHVIVAVTHCFDQSLIATVIEENVNPIEKIERSMLMIASTIHDVQPANLLKDASEVARVRNHSRAIFD